MLPSLFTHDRETGIHNLLQTTAGIKMLRRTKYRIAVLITTLIYLICWLPEVQFITRAFDLSQWSAPAVSLQALSELPGFLPIWVAVGGFWLYRYVLAVLCCGTAGRIGERLGRFLPTVLLSGILLGTMMWMLGR